MLKDIAYCANNDCEKRDECKRNLNNYEIKEEYYAVADFKNENCKFFMER